MICALGLKFINSLDYAVLLLFGHSVIQRKGENGLAVGNVIGSNIFNIVMVLAVSAAVKPIVVNRFAVIDAACLVVFSLITLALCKSRERLSRLEGLIMLGMYAAYLIYICIR